jgi:hypothetical protein
VKGGALGHPSGQIDHASVVSRPVLVVEVTQQEFIMSAAVYCPGLDDELAGKFDQLVFFGWVGVDDCHAGLGRSLDRVPVDTKLYLLCHGHAQLPLFSTSVGKWNAGELADRMMSDGLNKDHRDIEMLVCHAGESISTEKDAAKRMVIYQQWRAAQAANQAAEMKKLQDKFAKLAKKGSKPSSYDHEKKVLPLCAQLTQELKIRGFDCIRVIAYACEVAMYFGYTNEVMLDLTAKGGTWGVKASANPDYRKVWH